MQSSDDLPSQLDTPAAKLTKAELKSVDCWFPRADIVKDQPEMTAFKQAARFHQYTWREQRGLPKGTNPYDPNTAKPGRVVAPNGSRIEYLAATQSKANLLFTSARDAADHRIAHPQKDQMLNTQRLWCDLLSSMPMCFNLFGPLWADRDFAQRAVNAWFPDAPGTVSDIVFEWSPGRRDPDYLNNKTAFDVAIELDLGNNEFGIIGIETKYHEHAKEDSPPKSPALQRYLDVANTSQQFKDDKVDGIAGRPVQQLWQDHLLALSMKDHPSKKWTWVKYALVYPEGNVSFMTAANHYRDYLEHTGTFTTLTVEQLLSSGLYPIPDERMLHGRYLW